MSSIDRFVNFTSYISLAYKYVAKIKSYEMKIFGLKASHVMCLFHIGSSTDGLTAVELSALCMEDKAAISKALAQLREQRLIYADDDNGAKVYRAKYLATDEGRQVYEKISRFIESTVDECGKGVSAEQRAQFYASLELVTSNLREYYESLE